MPRENIENSSKAKEKVAEQTLQIGDYETPIVVYISYRVLSKETATTTATLFQLQYRYAGFIFYLAAVLHPLGAVHYYVDFGVGSSTSDVACHNLNFVHNACRIVTRPVNSLSASNGSLLSVLL